MSKKKLDQGAMNVCGKCKREYCYIKSKGHTATKCNSCMMNARRAGAKIRAIEHMGGACQLCGYKKCVRALVFHHRDPSQKDFGPSDKIGAISWENIKKELEKCILLCSNCHAEVHDGIATIPAYICQR